MVFYVKGQHAMRLRLFFTAMTGLWLVVPATALAHPFVSESVPVQSAATLTLDLAHGCVSDGRAHSDRAGEPTRVIGVRFPEAISVRTVTDSAGFVVEAPQRTDTYDTWTLRAPDGVDISAPVIAFAVVIDADVTDPVWLQVFQDCDTASHQWLATPEQQGVEPGVQVPLITADALAPPATAPPDMREKMQSTGDETGDGNAEPLIDFIGVEIPQSNEAWLWYVLFASVFGVLLAKRSRKQGR